MKARPRMVAFDLDGVVYRGARLMPGAREALEAVLDRRLELRYVTNNSTLHREDYSSKLASLGLPSGVERVITSGAATASWLRSHLPVGSEVFVVGEEGLLREIADAGLRPVHEVATVFQLADLRAVVVGWDRSFDFQALATAQEVLRSGALFVATNRDATFPAEDRLLPGAGAIVAAVETAAGREPVVMGKPGPALAEVLASSTSIPSAETMFVGDRLGTDILMAAQAGMCSVLVLSGVTKEAELALWTGRPPDYVLPDLTAFPALLERLVSRDD